MKPNAIVAQSGGPTAVINASACGVIQTAMESGVINSVYGATNGILGILKEDIFDISAEKAENNRGDEAHPCRRYRLLPLQAQRHQ